MPPNRDFAPNLRTAPRLPDRGVVPDLILGLAVAAITFVPATFGVSVLLAPVAWGWGAWESRRRRRRGLPVGVRIDSACVAAGFVTLLAGAPVVLFLVYALGVLALR